MFDFFFVCRGDTRTLVNDSSGTMPVIVKAQPQSQSQNQSQTQGQTEMQTLTPAANPFQSKQERGKAMRQVVAAFIANLGTINTGLVFGFSAVVIPQLKQKDSLIQIDESQASWIGKFTISFRFQFPSGIFQSHIDLDRNLITSTDIKITKTIL